MKPDPETGEPTPLQRALWRYRQRSWRAHHPEGYSRLNRARLTRIAVDKAEWGFTGTIPEARAILEQMIEIIMDDLAAGNDFTIPHLGQFRQNRRLRRRRDVWFRPTLEIVEQLTRVYREREAGAPPAPKQGEAA